MAVFDFVPDLGGVNTALSPDGPQAFLELGDGSTAAVSPTGKGRLRYNDTTMTFQTSVDGSAYADIGTGGGIGGGGAVNQVAFFSAATTITGDAGLIYDATNNALTIGNARIHTTGTNNIFIGPSTGNFTLTGTQNYGLGTSVLGLVTSGTGNHAFGFNALFSITTGSQNHAFGQSALAAATTPLRNNAFGGSSLGNLTTGERNCAFGYSALLNNNVSENNAFGNQTLDANTTGVRNNAFGADAIGANTTSSDLSAFGHNALLLATGASNSAFGSLAGDAITTGTGNSAFGHNALGAATTGADSVGVGRAAGLALTTGGTCTFLGATADTSLATATNSTAIGFGATVDASNIIVLGNGSVTVVRAGAHNTTDLGTTGVRWKDGFFAGNVEIGGKLTVTGAIDPTSILLSGGTALFYESNDGSTAPVSGASTGRLRYNNSTGTWQASTQGSAYQDIQLGAGAGGWTDDGTVVRLTTSTDNVSIGAAVAGGKLFIDGDADEIQLQVQAFAGQGTNVFEMQDSSGVAILYLNASSGAGSTLQLDQQSFASPPGSPPSVFTATGGTHTAVGVAVPISDRYSFGGGNIEFTTGAPIGTEIVICRVGGMSLTATAPTQTVTQATGLVVVAPTAGTNVTITNQFAMTASGAVSVAGISDRIQLNVRAVGGQTADIFVVETSTGTDIFTVDTTGATVTGKLTVTGAIDPTSILLSGGTALFYESNDGSTAPVSGANTGRIRYNDSTGTWQVSTQGGAYQDIQLGSGAGGWTDDGTVVRLTTATDAVSIGIATEIAKLGVVSDDNTVPVAILRYPSTPSADAFQIQDNAGAVRFRVDITGRVTSFPVGGGPSFFLDPNNGDHNWNDGTNNINVNYNPDTTTPQVAYSWSGGGTLEVIPSVDNTGQIGSASNRWALVRATVVTTGDLNLKSDDGQSDWTVKEEPDFIRLINRKNGKQYRMSMEEIG